VTVSISPLGPMISIFPEYGGPLSANRLWLYAAAETVAAKRPKEVINDGIEGIWKLQKHVLRSKVNQEQFLGPGLS
jgi:hypothetical protein